MLVLVLFGITANGNILGTHRLDGAVELTEVDGVAIPFGDIGDKQFALPFPSGDGHTATQFASFDRRIAGDDERRFGRAAVLGTDADGLGEEKACGRVGVVDDDGSFVPTRASLFTS